MEQFLDQLTTLVTNANSFIWGLTCLIPLLCGTGLYFTLRTGGVQIKHFPQAWKHTFGEIKLFGDRADKDGMSSFQALATAIAAQVGTGNLAGAATAIATGGPGAIFWMWIAAFFGMATIFAEAVLAQVFKSKDENGQVVGGPAYYISEGLKDKWFAKPLAAMFSIAIIIALGFIGNMVQSNSIAEAVGNSWGAINPEANIFAIRLGMGVLVGALCAYVFFGGMGRIASLTEKVVPIMAALYLLGGLWIVITHAAAIPAVLGSIFKYAFTARAAEGAAVGVLVKQAVRYGVARGLFSNEAGMGSTPHAHAVAKVAHPCDQGFVAIMGVFVDTFVVLNMTAFVIFLTGVRESTGFSGIALTQAGFKAGLGSWGMPFIAVCMFFFAFSTIVAWYFFGEQNIKYLFGVKALTAYRLIVIAFVIGGSVLKLDLVWELADFFNGFMALPNLIGLLGLSGIVIKQLRDYNQKAE